MEIGSQERNLDPYAGYAVPGTYYVGPLRLTSSILIYEYYVKASEAGSVVATGFDLNGGTITSAETGRAANLVFERTEVISSVDGRNRLVSPLTESQCFFRPFNSWPSLPGSANSGIIGLDVQAAAFCIEALTVTGTPQLPLIVGGRTRYANYVPALSVASQPIFSYTLHEGDVGNPGGCIGYGAPWRMNGGSIVLRGHKTPANLSVGSFPKPCGSTVTDENPEPSPPVWVDHVVFTGTPASEEKYRLGEQIRMAATFSDVVTVTGTPQLGFDYRIRHTAGGL